MDTDSLRSLESAQGQVRKVRKSSSLTSVSKGFLPQLSGRGSRRGSEWSSGEESEREFKRRIRNRANEIPSYINSESEYVCKECGMSFDSAKQFGNHKNKFCKGKKFESGAESLGEVVASLHNMKLHKDPEPSVDVAQLKKFIKTGHPNHVGPTNLEAMHHKLLDIDKDYKDKVWEYESGILKHKLKDAEDYRIKRHEAYAKRAMQQAAEDREVLNKYGIEAEKQKRRKERAQAAIDALMDVHPQKEESFRMPSNRSDSTGISVRDLFRDRVRDDFDDGGLPDIKVMAPRVKGMDDDETKMEAKMLKDSYLNGGGRDDKLLSLLNALELKGKTFDPSVDARDRYGDMGDLGGQVVVGPDGMMYAPIPPARLMHTSPPYVRPGYHLHPQAASSQQHATQPPVNPDAAMLRDKYTKGGGKDPLLLQVLENLEKNVMYVGKSDPFEAGDKNLRKGFAAAKGVVDAKGVFKGHGKGSPSRQLTFDDGSEADDEREKKVPAKRRKSVVRQPNLRDDGWDFDDFAFEEVPPNAEIPGQGGTLNEMFAKSPPPKGAKLKTFKNLADNDKVEQAKKNLDRKLEYLEPDEQMIAIHEAHMKEVHRLRTEMSQYKEFSKLNQLKASEYRTKLEQLRLHEGQMYELELSKLRQKREVDREIQELQRAANKRLDPRDAAELVASTGYQLDDGFTVYWDFVLGVPRRVRQARVVFGIYDGDAPIGNIMTLTPTEVEQIPNPPKPGLGLSMISQKTSHRRIPLSPTIKLVIEIQQVIAIVDDEGNQTFTSICVGWVIVYPFTEDGYLVNNRVMKVPLFRPPVDPTFTEDILVLQPTIEDVTLHFGILDSRVALDPPFNIAPSNVIHQYTFPDMYDPRRLAAADPGGGAISQFENEVVQDLAGKAKEAKKTKAELEAEKKEMRALKKELRRERDRLEEAKKVIEEEKRAVEVGKNDILKGKTELVDERIKAKEMEAQRILEEAKMKAMNGPSGLERKGSMPSFFGKDASEMTESEKAMQQGMEAMKEKMKAMAAEANEKGTALKSEVQRLEREAKALAEEKRKTEKEKEKLAKKLEKEKKKGRDDSSEDEKKKPAKKKKEKKSKKKHDSSDSDSDSDRKGKKSKKDKKDKKGKDKKEKSKKKKKGKDSSDSDSDDGKKKKKKKKKK